MPVYFPGLHQLSEYGARQGYFLDGATYVTPAVWFGIGINSTSQISGESPSRTIDDNSPGPQLSESGTAVAIALPFVGETSFTALEGERTAPGP